MGGSEVSRTFMLPVPAEQLNSRVLPVSDWRFPSLAG